MASQSTVIEGNGLSPHTDHHLFPLLRPSRRFANRNSVDIFSKPSSPHMSSTSSPFSTSNPMLDPDSASHNTPVRLSHSSSYRPSSLSSTLTRDMIPFVDIDPQAVIWAVGQHGNSHSPADSCRATADQAQSRILDDSLAESLHRAGSSDKQLLARVASAAEKLKKWCDELRQWSWRGGFHLQKPHFLSQPCPAGLSPDLISHYEQRLGEISDELLDLDLESPKHHINGMILVSSSGMPSGFGRRLTPGLSSSADSNVSFVDDVSLLITHFVMVSLPLHSDLKQMLNAWKSRLYVLRRSPSFLQRLDTGYSSISDASASFQSLLVHVKTCMDRGGGDLSSLETQSHMNTLVDFEEALKSTISHLGSTLDSMLDRVEWMGDSLPESWIDRYEELERQYKEWAGSFQVLKLRLKLIPIRKTNTAQETLMVHPVPEQIQVVSSPENSRPVSVANSVSTVSSSSETETTVTISSPEEGAPTKVVMRVINQAPTLVNVNVSSKPSTPTVPESPIVRQDHGRLRMANIRCDTALNSDTFDSDVHRLDLDEPVNSKTAIGSSSPDAPGPEEDSLSFGDVSKLTLDGDHSEFNYSFTSFSCGFTSFSRHSSATSRSSEDSGEPKTPAVLHPPSTPTIRDVPEPLVRDAVSQVDHTEVEWQSEESRVGHVSTVTPTKRPDHRILNDSPPSMSPSPNATPLSVQIPKTRNRTSGSARAPLSPSSSSVHDPSSSSKSLRPVKEDDLNDRILSILGQIQGGSGFQISPKPDRLAVPSTPTPRVPRNGARPARITNRPSLNSLRHKRSRVQGLRASFLSGSSSRSISDVIPSSPRTPQSTGSVIDPSAFTLVPDSQIRRLPSHSSLRDATPGSIQNRRLSSSGVRISSAPFLTNSFQGGSDIQLYHLIFPHGHNGDDSKQRSKLLYIRSTEEGRVMIRVGGGWSDLADWLRTFIEHHPLRRSNEGSDHHDGVRLTPASSENTTDAFEWDVETAIGDTGPDGTVHPDLPRAISPAPSHSGTLGREESRQRLGSSSYNRRSLSQSIGSPGLSDTPIPTASLAGPGFDRTRGAVSLSDQNKQWVEDMVSKAKLASSSGRDGLTGAVPRSQSRLSGMMSPPPTGVGMAIEDDDYSFSDMGTVRGVTRVARPRRSVL